MAIFKTVTELDEINRFERIPSQIYESAEVASKAVAEEIAELIKAKQKKGESAVLGLATGSTPVKIYAELVRLHKEEGLSFLNVTTFNLDEYFPMQPDSLQSYVRFMNEHLFNHVDIPSENIHIPDGTLESAEVRQFCKVYEAKIQNAGGIDIQILGIGRTGHIGFNEPGSLRDSKTRMITLDQRTRIDAAADFFGEEFVPRKAVTMGISTIMTARKVFMMAWGEGKAGIIKTTVEGPASENIPATILQSHPDTLVVLDQASSSELTRIKTPWLVGSCQWDDKTIRRAVIWLCSKVSKPILKLTERDYSDNGMNELLTEKGSAHAVNIHIFNILQHTITGWPGGKPDADDTHRPERKSPFPKRVVLFSPHPDDDVISMGGTFIRLADHGHELHVAYQTSGNIAVFDDDALRFADFVKDFGTEFNFDTEASEQMFEDVRSAIENKKDGEPDAENVKQIKGLIRRGEARAGARYVGLPDERIHFLDLPFYETGTVKKKPIGEDDIRIVMDLLKKVQPHQIYAAGDLSDPHGTHRVCLDAIFQAVERLKNEDWVKDCRLWLYRGAWQEWGVEDIEMAVPISPQELLRKRRAIFKHQSQKDRPLFPGSDPREFWQRAEDRNRDTADAYNRLGLAEYEAIEAFVRWHF